MYGYQLWIPLTIPVMTFKTVTKKFIEPIVDEDTTLVHSNQNANQPYPDTVDVSHQDPNLPGCEHVWTADHIQKIDNRLEESLRTRCCNETICDGSKLLRVNFHTSQSAGHVHNN